MSRTGPDSPSPGGAAESAAAAEPFPRGTASPSQSPIYWVAEKDRYIRQLLIRDIEAQTGRRLIVYLADCENPTDAGQIHPSDDSYFTELLKDVTGEPVDLLLETAGGYTDATEKLVAILRALAPDLRVAVPRKAKSNGTLVALAGSTIIMGPSSELGPIDPNIVLGPNNQVPAQFILQSPNVDPILSQFAAYAVAQTKKLATTLLQTGMLSGNQASIPAVVDMLATRNHFHSHGSVIDADEAAALGLNITKLDVSDPLWERLWLLRCMYAFDMQRAGLVKIFEGRRVSNAFQAIT